MEETQKCQGRFDVVRVDDWNAVRRDRFAMTAPTHHTTKATSTPTPKCQGSRTRPGNKRTWPSWAAVWTSFSTDSRMVPFFLRTAQSRRPQQHTREEATLRRWERSRAAGVGVGVAVREVVAMIEASVSLSTLSSSSKPYSSGHHDTRTDRQAMGGKAVPTVACRQVIASPPVGFGRFAHSRRITCNKSSAEL